MSRTVRFVLYGFGMVLALVAAVVLFDKGSEEGGSISAETTTEDGRKVTLAISGSLSSELQSDAQGARVKWGNHNVMFIKRDLHVDGKRQEIGAFKELYVLVRKDGSILVKRDGATLRVIETASTK